MSTGDRDTLYSYNDAQAERTYTQDELDAAVAAERERCAKVCDAVGDCGPENGCCPTYWNEAVEACVKAIVGPSA